MKKKVIKPKIKVNKLSENPLFIKFLNWEGDKYTIENMMLNIIESFEKEEDKDIVRIRLSDLTDDYLNSLTDFQNKYRSYMSTAFNTKNIPEEFLEWMSNSFKYISETTSTYANDETKEISIKDSEGRWFEAMLCYNFILTFNYFGFEIVKICPICTSYFCHKGKYAKYCKDGCKEIGMGKK